MVFGSKGRTPYEIMGQRPSAPAADEEEPRQAPTPAPPAEAEPPLWDLRALVRDAASPVVLRVPRGVAAGVIVGVVLVILAAYLVGSVRGEAAGRNEVLQQLEGIEGRTADGLTAPWLQPDPEAAAEETREARLYDLSDPDPRQSGLNYLYFGSFHETETRELAEYLVTQGFDAMIRPSYTERLFRVYLLEGFERQDPDFEQQAVFQVRAWRQSRGINEPLENNQKLWERYDAES